MSKHYIPHPILAFGAMLMLAACSTTSLIAPVPLAPVAEPSATVPMPTPTVEPSATVSTPTATPQIKRAATALPTPTPGFAAQVLARAQVPILCYHQIRDWEEDEAEVDMPYIVPPALFAEQMDFLDQQGYHPISPDQLLAYLTYGAALPERPVMITFDDSDATQWTEALPVLKRHGFTATFFIMTVVLDKPYYLSSQQVQALDRMGMTIGAHTWDHHSVTRYTADDWEIQIAEPTAQLAELTGHPIKYFAYPYGLWDTAAIGPLKRAGFVAAFQLEEEMDTDAPLFTIRRMIANSFWTAEVFQEAVGEHRE
jgi:peptidoglycan/xylan/chitin deacetylase (PgdA/CDA1 family)